MNFFIGLLGKTKRKNTHNVHKKRQIHFVKRTKRKDDSLNDDYDAVHSLQTREMPEEFRV